MTLIEETMVVAVFASFPGERAETLPGEGAPLRGERAAPLPGEGAPLRGERVAPLPGEGAPLRGEKVAPLPGEGAPLPLAFRSPSPACCLVVVFVGFVIGSESWFTNSELLENDECINGGRSRLLLTLTLSCC